MKNKVITVDCDEVLAETMDSILEYYNYNIN
jgi:5'(3')-deoxyribonucleotidase